ncbi:MAG: nicotinate-nicotinamide nucleotide adenylyltransferase [Gaiellaceae bacterium]
MTVGILGGAFDPPHNGHLELARSAIRHLGLERLVVLVSDRPGHKPVELGAPIRLRLVQAAFEDVPGAEVVLDEHAYTADALADGRFDGAYFVLGADQLAGFPGWKEPQRVLEHVRLAVGTRPGYPPERLEAVLARLERPDRVVLFGLDHPVAVSSTEIRSRARRGDPLDGLVPPQVGALIWELGLYAP